MDISFFNYTYDGKFYIVHYKVAEREKQIVLQSKQEVIRACKLYLKLISES